LVANAVLAAQQPVPVEAVTAHVQPLYETIHLSGTVTSGQVATLSLSTSGLVSNVLVDEGQRVHKNDIMLELDSKLAKLNRDTANARVKETEFAWQDAIRRRDELHKLKLQQSIAQTAIKDIESEVKQDQAVYQQRVFEARYEETRYQQHQLLAPFDGIISKKLTETGEWVVPGDGVFELVATDQLRIDFAVSEDYLSKVRVGTPITYSAGAYPEKKWQTVVSTVVPVSDPVARTFVLRTSIAKNAASLIPGMSVNAVLKVAAGRQGLVVHKDAILRYPDGRVVLWTVAYEEGKPVARKAIVQTGLAFDDSIEVTGELKASTPIIVKGNETLQEGQSVYLLNKQQ
jgi:RND family efflux transporter MFP subunit